MNEQTFGLLNGHAVGIIFKELVRRAIDTIRNERLTFEVQVKQSYSGTMDDVLTTADKKAQAVYLKSIQECFPGVGIVAEEDSLSIPAREGVDAFITIDPLDGTKAFVRRQSTGVGTMIALVAGGKVVSAYIGDVNTREVFGFRPGSGKAHRITDLNVAEELGVEDGRLPFEKYILLRERPEDHSALSQQVIERFKNIEVTGGSIGIWFARLWKREVGGLLLPPSWETPWDSAPVVGISRQLGYIFLRYDSSLGLWEEYEPEIRPEKYRRDHDTLVVSRSDLPYIQAEDS